MILWFSWPGEQIVEAVESLHGDRMPRRDTSTLGRPPLSIPSLVGQNILWGTHLFSAFGSRATAHP